MQQKCIQLAILRYDWMHRFSVTMAQVLDSRQTRPYFQVVSCPAGLALIVQTPSDNAWGPEVTLTSYVIMFENA